MTARLSPWRISNWRPEGKDSSDPSPVGLAPLAYAGRANLADTTTMYIGERELKRTLMKHIYAHYYSSNLIGATDENSPPQSGTRASPVRSVLPKMCLW